MVYNITAATGQLGPKIVDEALKVIRPEDLVLTVRNPDKAERFKAMGVEVRKGDYEDEAELSEAFRDTDVLIYIPSLTFPSLPRVIEFENSIEAARKAGVGHIIYIGFLADQETNPFIMSPAYGYIHRRLASSGLAYTYIRNALYADPLPPYLPELVERGRLPYPAGEGRISFISRQDVARAVVRIAVEEKLQGKTWTLTGKRNYSMVELAELLSRVSGETIVYGPMPAEEFTSTYDEPEGFGPVLTSMYVAAAQEMLDEVTDDFRKIVGEDPKDLEDFIRREYLA